MVVSPARGWRRRLGHAHAVGRVLAGVLLLWSGLGVMVVHWDGSAGRGVGGRTRNNSVENCSRVMADGERGGAAAGAGIGAGPALASQL